MPYFWASRQRTQDGAYCEFAVFGVHRLDNWPMCFPAFRRVQQLLRRIVVSAAEVFLVDAVTTALLPQVLAYNWPVIGFRNERRCHSTGPNAAADPAWPPP